MESSENATPLAERLYTYQKYEDELFDTVNSIMGSDVAQCGDENFRFAVNDTFWDSYDGSVEVVLDAATPWMTNEQATRILDLGFKQIYASRGEEMENIFWYHPKPEGSADKVLVRHLYTDGRSREGNEDNRWRAKYRTLLAPASHPASFTPK